MGEPELTAKLASFPDNEESQVEWAPETIVTTVLQSKPNVSESRPSGPRNNEETRQNRPRLVTFSTMGLPFIWRILFIRLSRRITDQLTRFNVVIVIFAILMLFLLWLCFRWGKDKAQKS